MALEGYLRCGLPVMLEPALSMLALLDSGAKAILGKEAEIYEKLTRLTASVAQTDLPPSVGETTRRPLWPSQRRNVFSLRHSSSTVVWTTALAKKD